MRKSPIVPVGLPRLTDIQDQGTWGLREDVQHHGKRGKEAFRPSKRQIVAAGGALQLNDGGGEAFVAWPGGVEPHLQAGLSVEPLPDHQLGAGSCKIASPACQLRVRVWRSRGRDAFHGRMTSADEQPNQDEELEAVKAPLENVPEPGRTVTAEPPSQGPRRRLKLTTAEAEVPKPLAFGQADPGGDDSVPTAVALDRRREVPEVDRGAPASQGG
jgi:hypothetical protein